MYSMESWLNDIIKNENLNLRNFQTTERKDRKRNRWGSVATYIKDGICYKRRADLKDAWLELIWTEIHTKRGIILLGTYYASPDTTIESLGPLEENLDRVFDLDAPTFVCGDYNIDVSELPNQLDTLCNLQSMDILNRNPTHITRTSAKCLDTFMTNARHQTRKIITTGPALSNHSALILNVENEVPRKEPCTKILHQYHETDLNGVRSHITEYRLPDLDEGMSLDENVIHWTEKLKEDEAFFIRSGRWAFEESCTNGWKTT